MQESTKIGVFIIKIILKFKIRKIFGWNWRVNERLRGYELKYFAFRAQKLVGEAFRAPNWLFMVVVKIEEDGIFANILRSFGFCVFSNISEIKKKKEYNGIFVNMCWEEG